MANNSVQLPNAEKVLQRAVRKALKVHERAGVPAAIWKNGKVAFVKFGKKKK